MLEQLALNNTGLNKSITERSIWYLTFRMLEPEYLASVGDQGHTKSGILLLSRIPYFKEGNVDLEKKYSHGFNVLTSTCMKKTELGAKISHSLI